MWCNDAVLFDPFCWVNSPFHQSHWHGCNMYLICTGNNDTSQKDEVSSSTSKNKDEDDSDMYPRKRKLRSKIDTNSTQPPPPEPVAQLPQVSYEKPPNPFELYLSIRRQVGTNKRLHVVMWNLVWSLKNSLNQQIFH